MLTSSKSRAQVDGEADPGVREASIAADDPDHELVELVTAGGHTAALREAMRGHRAAVYRYCREELHDAGLADDVQQQIFVQVHRDMAAFAGRARFRTWLFAIARNRV